MTRGFVYMFRLRVGKAFAANPLAPVALALLLWTAAGAGRRSSVAASEHECGVCI